MIVAVAFPLSVAAQQGNSQTTSTASVEVPTATGTTVQAQAANLVSIDSSLFSTYPAYSYMSPLAEDGTPQSQSKASNEQTSSRPKIGGSMVGYIDDAIVGSEIRVRFDAAGNDEFPDLAEFFYAKCGCYKSLGTLDPVALDPNTPGPGGGVPKDVNFQQLFVRAELAPWRHFSFYVDVPFRWIQPQGFLAFPPFPPFGNQGGIGDVDAGVKVAVIASTKQYLTFQLQGDFPSGNASDGLGTNHYSIAPELTYYQRLSGRAALEAEAGISAPIGGSAGVPITSSSGFAGSVFIYGVGPSYKIYEGERAQIAPVLELVGWHVLSGLYSNVGGTIDGTTNSAAGINIVNLKLGVRTNFGRNSIYVGYGHALTRITWYQDIFRVEYRVAF
jgi:hypothetical protein